MFETIKLIHKISVILFLLIYFIKTILLISNKEDLLAKLTKTLKVPEMIVSALFLLTGIYLLTQIPEIKPLMIVKVGLVFLSIPIAVIGFKKKNKILGALSLLMITASYGLAEIAAKNSGDKITDKSGEEIYEKKCALCHGADGKLGMAGAADISATQLDTVAIANVILMGKGNMKKIEGLSQDQARAVALYVKNGLKN